MAIAIIPDLPNFIKLPIVLISLSIAILMVLIPIYRKLPRSSIGIAMKVGIYVVPAVLSVTAIMLLIMTINKGR